MEKAGNSYSRSNSVRPYQTKTVWFLLLTSIGYACLGGTILLSNTNLTDVLDRIGWCIVGMLALAMGGLSVIIAVCNCIRCAIIATLSRKGLRTRLRREKKSHRYVVKGIYFRSAIVGAIFFGLMLMVRLFAFFFRGL